MTSIQDPGESRFHVNALPGKVSKEILFRMKNLATIIVFALFSELGRAAEPVPKMAGVARFDIVADVAVGKLDSGSLEGNGEVTRASWLDSARVPGSYTVQVPITHFSWRQIQFTFVPEHDGQVTVSLLGPWEAGPDRNLFKEEVLWSNFSRDGKSETFDEWRGEAPVNGEPEVARAWHNSRKEESISVKAGLPVKLALEARAVLPKGFSEMTRIQGGKSPAHRAIARFRRGVNFGNFLEAPRGQDWGARYTIDDFKAAAREGFDHVRIPIRWNDWAGEAPDYRIDPSFYAKCDSMVTNALGNHLSAIVNLHHFDDFYKDPIASKTEFFALWKQISEHYKDYPPESLAFELLNEPMDKATTEVINPLLADAIRIVRKACPNHTIFIGPGLWNSVAELKNLNLPAGDSNLIVTVHCYDPFNFTHQGAYWLGGHMETKGVIFPGPPPAPLEPTAATKARAGMAQWFESYNSTPREKNPSSPRAFQDKIQTAHDWSIYYGRPVHFGEFGVIANADDISRANWYREFRTRLESNDLSWAIWDWKANFPYWDSKLNKPRPGMREALFAPEAAVSK